MKTKKSEMVRFRCEPNLKVEVNRVAVLKQLDAADIIRIALRDYLAQFRQTNGAQN
jgi:hypothetical protein